MKWNRIFLFFIVLAVIFSIVYRLSIPRYLILPIIEYKQPINSRDSVKIYDELIKLQSIIDSSQNKKIRLISNLSPCKKGDALLGLNIWDMPKYSTDRQYLYENKYSTIHKRDSLIDILALDAYFKALCHTSDDGSLPIIQGIAGIYMRQGYFDKSRELYYYTINSNSCNDSLRYVSLDGIEKTLRTDKESVFKRYSIKKEMVMLYEQLYPNHSSYELMTLYQDLGYLGSIIQSEGYVNYCLKAIDLAKNTKTDLVLYNDTISSNTFLLFATSLGSSYYESPYIIMGDYYLKSNDYENALKYYKETFPGDINFMHINGEDTFRDIKNSKVEFSYKNFGAYPLFLLKMAKCYLSMGDELGVKYLYESCYWAVYDILHNFYDSSDDFKDGYKLYESILNCICNKIDPIWLYNRALFTKGFTNNIEIDLKGKYSHNDLYIQYLRLRAYCNKFPNNKYALNNLRDISARLYNDDVHKNWLKSILYTYEDVYRAIGHTRSVAIEFMNPYTLEDDVHVYYAMIICPQSPEPIQICLGDVTDFESLAIVNPQNKVWRQNDTTRQQLDKKYYQNGYDLIWSKLEPYINDGDNVYFSPAGLLHQMNIEVFQDADGKRANEKWNLHRVSSTRELCMEKPEIDMTSAVLYGNLLYDVDSTTMVAESRTYRQEDNYVASRGFVQDSTMRDGWNRLVATNTEINSIAITMQNSGIEPTIYRLEAGNEESFKALSGKKTPIIHLATHGFFYKDEEAKTKTFFETLDMNKNNYALDNSLKRSGLILAGAQKAWLGEPIPDNVEDGVLLAEEIATMDLMGTDLVVLSACETGLGEITSEGVFGLQRAFKKAGVQTLIMSLWKVDDNATSLFMRTFYKQWLGGKSKHAAFLDAQAAVRECKEHDYSNPYYWASFIMLD